MLFIIVPTLFQFGKLTEKENTKTNINTRFKIYYSFPEAWMSPDPQIHFYQRHAVMLPLKIILIFFLLK